MEHISTFFFLHRRSKPRRTKRTQQQKENETKRRIERLLSPKPSPSLSIDEKLTSASPSHQEPSFSRDELRFALGASQRSVLPFRTDGSVSSTPVEKKKKKKPRRERPRVNETKHVLELEMEGERERERHGGW